MVGELLAGFACGTQETRNREELSRFLASPESPRACDRAPRSSCAAAGHAAATAETRPVRQKHHGVKFALACGGPDLHRLRIGGADGSELLWAEAQILREQKRCQGVGMDPNGKGWRCKRHGPSEPMPSPQTTTQVPSTQTPPHRTWTTAQTLDCGLSPLTNPRGLAAHHTAFTPLQYITLE